MEFGLISIIMAAYNAEKTIARAIDSVLVQKYEDFELLIVDDCSKDGTADIAAAFAAKDSRVRLFRNDENHGPVYSRWRAVNEACGEWIAILDSDDAWTYDKLSKQRALWQRTGGSLFYTGSAFVDESGSPIRWTMHVPEQISYELLLKQNILSNSSALVRKELYERYYALKNGIHEDYVVWLSILRDGVTAYGIDEPLLIYRVSNASKSGNKLKSARMNWNSYRYIGLNLVQAVYYEACYMLRGIVKYAKLALHSQ